MFIHVGDWPGGQLSAMECAYPESIDGGIDLCLPIMCRTHMRSIWWCPNVSVLWCDGGPPAYEYHTLEDPPINPPPTK